LIGCILLISSRSPLLRAMNLPPYL
jgi:hypothetical protein